MTLDAERKRLERAGTLHGFHWVVVALSVIMTVAAWYVSKSQLEEKRALRFGREAGQVIELVVERMEKYEDALWGGVALIHVLKDSVEYDQWLHYANSIRITDQTEVLYDEHQLHEEDFDPNPQFKKSVDIEFYGRTWTFDVWSTKSFREATTNTQPTTIPP